MTEQAPQTNLPDGGFQAYEQQQYASAVDQEPVAPTEAVERQAALEAVFGDVASFAANPDRKFAAGSDIAKATGMNHQKAMELGFKDYADLEKHAVTWKAEKDAAAALEAAAKQEAAKEAAYKQESEDKDAAWKAEREEYRTNRDQKAKKALGAGSYKEMLENGGALAYEKRAKIAAKAAREPSVLIVPTNKAAEERQAEYAAQLRSFDRQLNTGKNAKEPAALHHPSSDEHGAKNTQQDPGEQLDIFLDKLSDRAHDDVILALRAVAGSHAGSEIDMHGLFTGSVLNAQERQELLELFEKDGRIEINRTGDWQDDDGLPKSVRVPGEFTPGAPDPNPFVDPMSKEALAEFSRDIEPDLLRELGTELDAYTRLAAGRERVSMASREFSDSKVEAARTRYETTRHKINVQTAMKMREAGYSEVEIYSAMTLNDKTEAKLIALTIRGHVEQLSNPEGRFAEKRARMLSWWAKQGGDMLFKKKFGFDREFFSKDNINSDFFKAKSLRGTLKKAGVMAAVGLPVGIIAGAAGAALIGPLAGGALAAAGARGVARGLLSAKVNQAANASTVAKQQAEHRLQKQLETIDARYNGLIATAASGDRYVSVTDLFAEGTANSVGRNRRRLVGSAALGAVMGSVGASVAHHLIGGNSGSHKSVGNRPGGVHESTSPKPAPSSSQVPGTGRPSSPPAQTSPTNPGNGLPGPGEKPPVGGTGNVRFTLSNGGGDSLWNEVSQYNNGSLSQAQINSVTRGILKANNLSLSQARNLPVGFTFNISPDQLQALIDEANTAKS